MQPRAFVRPVDAEERSSRLNDLLAQVDGAPMSAPEIMGIYGLDELREHARRLLRAIWEVRDASNPARALSRMRSHARAVLDALRKVRRARLPTPGRIVADLVNALSALVTAEHLAALDLDDLEVVVAVGASRVLGDLAATHGLPAEGASISVGRYAPTTGDYRVDERGCWLWLRATNRGQPMCGERRGHGQNRAGRIYYILVNGPIPDRHDVVRTCETRLCVNPAHARVRNRAQRGVENRARLSFEDATDIRNAIAAGVSRRALADDYAVSTWAISDIVTNRSWGDPSYVRGLPLEGGSVTSRPTWRSAAGDYRIDPATSCWIWLRTLSTRGRPRIPDRAHHHQSAARVYFEKATGPAPRDLLVTRTCGNLLCVNPLHGALSTSRRVRSHGSHRASARGLRFRRATLLAVQPVLERARRSAIAARYARRGLWLARSMDAPIGSDPRARTLADTVSTADGDPYEAMRSVELQHLLDGILDESMAAALPEEARLALQRRLLDAGFAPSTS
jgi:hypothetical protein